MTVLLEDATKLVLDFFGAFEEDGVEVEEGGRLTTTFLVVPEAASYRSISAVYQLYV